MEISGHNTRSVFDRFFRVTGTGANGSGLGLSIVARIAEYFGARLDFGTGISGQGLAVHVSFPLPAVASEHRRISDAQRLV